MLTAACLFLSAAAQAQSVEEIVKKHNQAIGGDAWKKITSLVFSGNVSANGMDIPVRITKVKDKGMRTNIEAMGVKGFIIITPTAGWQFLPFGNGQTKPEAMTAEMVKAQQSEMELGDDLMNYQARGGKLEYIGKEKVDSTECFKLSLTNKDGAVKTLYIDPATYFTVREERKIKADGKEMEAKRTYTDYQILPEGIVVAMSMGGDMGETKIYKVEVNTVKDDSMFKPETGKGG